MAKNNKTKNCAFCGTLFIPKKFNQRFCRGTCKSEYSRKKREELLNAKSPEAYIKSQLKTQEIREENIYAVSKDIKVSDLELVGRYVKRGAIVFSKGKGFTINVIPKTIELKKGDIYEIWIRKIEI